MKYQKNTVLVIGLLLLILTAEFIFGRKQLDYGFFIDDWDNLAAYKIVVQNPIADLAYAWKTLGSHRFAHVYYMGILFEAFKFNYEYYNIFNQLLKAISALTLFPIIYLLFRSKLLAFLTTLLYVTHFSPFGALDDVSRGEDFLAIITFNLFLAVYIRASQKKTFNIKTLLVLLILFISIAFFAPSRTYPVLLMLPLLELFNFFLNRSSTTFRSSLLRLIFFYSPFIVALLFSQGSILAEIGYYKSLWGMLRLGNFQLLLAPLASFGSMFIPNNIQLSLFGDPHYQSLEAFFESILPRVLIFFGFFYTLIGFLLHPSPKRFIFRTLLISFCFSIPAFVASNHWLYIDNKFRASVDPGVFLSSALVGLFILSLAISLLKELLSDRKNPLLLGFSIPPIISFLYIFMTWVLTDVNSIFMGVHAYLNIPAIGTSLYLAILLYLIYQKITTRIIANFTLIICVILFFRISVQTVDTYFSYWLKNGFAASDQERMRNTFWNEIGKEKKFNYQNPALIYLDSFEDYANGMYYENAFVWKIPAFLLVERGNTLAKCDAVMYKVELNKLKVEIINGKRVITVDRCGPKIIYPIENFYSFKLRDRNIIPNRAETLQKLGINYYE